MTGNVAAGQNARLQSGQGITAGSVVADGATSLTTASGNITLSGTVKAGGGDLTIEAASGSINAASLISFNNMALTAGTDIAAGNLTAQRLLSSGDTLTSATGNLSTNATAHGDLDLTAGGTLTSEHDGSKSTSGFLSKKNDKNHTYDEPTVASELRASGNVNLSAGDTIAISGSKVTAGENIAIEGDSVSIIGAQDEHDATSAIKKSGFGAGPGRGFYSVWGKEEKSNKESIVANVGSQFSAGNDVSIKARDSDVNIVGSKVEAGNDIAIDAGRDVNILPGETQLIDNLVSRGTKITPANLVDIRRLPDAEQFG